MKKALINLQKKIQPYLCGLTPILKHSKQIFIDKKEIIIKVSVPLVIIVLGYAACSHSQRIITKNIQSIFSISDAIRAYYADKPNYWGLDTDYVIKQNIAPAQIIKQNALILDGNIQIFIGSGFDADTVLPMAESYDIVVHHLNKAQCMSYAEKDLSDEQRISLLSLSIINGSGVYIFEWGGRYSLPIQKYATKKLCADKDNTLIWSLK